MIKFYQKYQDSGRYTQFGEFGIIQEVIRRINPEEHTAVEFGSPNFTYCSNTAHLWDQGWDVIHYDIDKNTDARIIHQEITVDNVNEIVGRPTVLSIDCDGPDADIWEAYKGQAPIVIIEIDSSVLPPAIQLPSKHNAASYWHMVNLGIEKEYTLICHTGGNLIWVLNKYANLFPEITADPLHDWELYFDKRHVK